MQIYMHGHGKAGHQVRRQSDINTQMRHTLVHWCMDSQGHRIPVISRFKQIQASVLQRHSEAGRGIESGRWGTALVRLRGVPMCNHMNVHVREPQLQTHSVSGQTRSLHIYACPLPGPSLVAVYGALAFHGHPVPAVTSFGS